MANTHIYIVYIVYIYIYIHIHTIYPHWIRVFGGSLGDHHSLAASTSDWQRPDQDFDRTGSQPFDATSRISVYTVYTYAQVYTRIYIYVYKSMIHILKYIYISMRHIHIYIYI